MQSQNRRSTNQQLTQQIVDLQQQLSLRNEQVNQLEHEVKTKVGSSSKLRHTDESLNAHDVDITPAIMATKHSTATITMAITVVVHRPLHKH